MMTTDQYLAALEAAGIDLPASAAIDVAAGRLLKIDERTARRYRYGEIAVPGPVQVALIALGELRALTLAAQQTPQSRRRHGPPS
jgi:hypothetical protein